MWAKRPRSDWKSSTEKKTWEIGRVSGDILITKSNCWSSGTCCCCCCCSHRNLCLLRSQAEWAAVGCCGTVAVLSSRSWSGLDLVGSWPPLLCRTIVVPVWAKSPSSRPSRCSAGETGRWPCELANWHRCPDSCWPCRTWCHCSCTTGRCVGRGSSLGLRLSTYTIVVRSRSEPDRDGIGRACTGRVAVAVAAVDGNCRRTAGYKFVSGHPALSCRIAGCMMAACNSYRC